ncbi:MAG TPA: deoxyribonuclease IV [Thermoanaerobaculia bacterium]|nr:deoxyribonuclease IV [Thermoanaerobaculia bacterium]
MKDVSGNGRPRFRFAAPGDLLGAHLSTRGGICSVFERAARIEASAFALFAKNSNQWLGKPLAPEEAARFGELRAGLGNPPVLTHASYLINLATTSEEFHRKSIAGLVDELKRAERLGAFAVVLHPGAHMGAGVDAGLDRIARSLDRVHAEIDTNVVTLLETAAGQGSCLGCTFEELGRIMKLVDDPRRLGVCVDTCHVFSAGYDLRTRDGWERIVGEIDAEVGVGNVGAFHLNDSKRDLGSRVDRHEHIGEGRIGLEPFAFILNDERFDRVPKVLETPKPDEFEADRRNLSELRALLRPTADSAPRSARPGAP